MQLVEHHRISRSDPRFAALDAAAFASKNLYNVALYTTRQAYIFRGERIPYPRLAHELRTQATYRALPAKVSQWVVKQVCAAWDSFFAARAVYARDPSRFVGRPKLPQYKAKDGRNLLTYTIQALSRVALRRGIVTLSGVAVEIPTQQTRIAQVRVVPRGTHYAVEVVYEQEVQPADVNPTWSAGIDLGVSNLVAIATSKPGVAPCLVNGRPLKALNQAYNKARARLQAKLPKGRSTSRQLAALTDARNRRVRDYLHNASRAIITWLLQERIGTLIIGHNPDWKQGVRLGRRTNQTFVSIPFARLIAMLTYKAELVGIRVITHDEAYTSKCSFFDGEPVGKRTTYMGKRLHRGLFRTASGRRVNADINAAYNQISNVAPDAFGPGRRGAVVAPGRIALPNRQVASYNAMLLDTIVAPSQTCTRWP
jgi:putative transposase